jgi:ArsR family transcriptional regulator, virulence genes transcriptional regulator
MNTRDSLDTDAIDTKTSLGAEMQARAEEAADMLKALSNPQRLRVMCLLIDGEKTVGELNAQVDLSQSALSQHLAVLRDNGLVQTRREAQSVYYSVAAGPVHRIIETLHDIYCPTSDDLACDGNES